MTARFIGFINRLEDLPHFYISLSFAAAAAAKTCPVFPPPPSLSTFRFIRDGSGKREASERVEGAEESCAFFLRMEGIGRSGPAAAAAACYLCAQPYVMGKPKPPPTRKTSLLLRLVRQVPHLRMRANTGKGEERPLGGFFECRSDCDASDGGSGGGGARSMFLRSSVCLSALSPRMTRQTMHRALGHGSIGQGKSIRVAQ